MEYECPISNRYPYVYPFFRLYQLELVPQLSLVLLLSVLYSSEFD